MMPSAKAQKTRGRPSDGPAEPPAKRAKHSQPSKSGASLEAVLLGDKRKPLKAVTSNGIDLSRSHVVNATGAVLGVADEGGDVDMTDIIGAKKSAAKSKAKALQPDSEEESEEESEDSEQEQDDDAVEEATSGAIETKSTVNGVTSSSSDKPQLNGHTSDDEDEEINAEPSFGELARVNRTDPIDVEAPFATTDALTLPTTRNLSAPSGTSLSTVLTQALKTSDKQLLESCLEINDLDSIRSTIERLPSPLVAALLTSIAERMHRSPGRANNLMIWVQWSLVAHGGYLAGQPAVVKKLRGLQRVIRLRAEALQRLLPLKGRLDMISAQMELRASMAARSGTRRDEEEDEPVIYIEGRDDVQAADEEDEDELLSGRQKQIGGADDDMDSEDEDDGFMSLLPNGIQSAVDSVDEEESGDDLDKLVDDEAEETDEDGSDGDDLNDEIEGEDADDLEDDDDSDDDEESASEDEPAPKLRRSNATRHGGFAVRS